MARPILGDEKKQDVTLSLLPSLYEAAKIYAKGRSLSVSQLVDDLLARELGSTRIKEAKASLPVATPKKKITYKSTLRKKANG